MLPFAAEAGNYAVAWIIDQPEPPLPENVNPIGHHVQVCFASSDCHLFTSYYKCMLESNSINSWNRDAHSASWIKGYLLGLNWKYALLFRWLWLLLLDFFYLKNQVNMLQIGSCVFSSTDSYAIQVPVKITSTHRKCRGFFCLISDFSSVWDKSKDI